MSFAAAREKVKQREQGVFARLRERQSNGRPPAGEGMAALRARKQRAEAQAMVDRTARRYEEAMEAERAAFLAFDKVDADPRKRHTMKWLRLHDAWRLACRRQDLLYSTLHNVLASTRSTLRDHHTPPSSRRPVR